MITKQWRSQDFERERAKPIALYINIVNVKQVKKGAIMSIFQ